MSGPGGQSTKRDERRDSRRAQYQRRQLERQRERQRQIRQKQIRQWSIIGAGALVLLIVLFFIINAIVNPPKSGPLQPASGQKVDNLSCGSETVAYHIHEYLEVYVDGSQVAVPEGVGIVAPEGSGVAALGHSGSLECLYPLHVHQGEPNIIHLEAPQQTSYDLGVFFDIWGQQLSSTQFMGNKVDATHKLVIEVYDKSGKLVQTYTGDPRKLVIAEGQTVAMLYNSPNVKPQPYDWSKFNG